MNRAESLKRSLAEVVNNLDQEGLSLYFVNLGRGVHTLVLAENAESVRFALPLALPLALQPSAYLAFNVTDGLLGHLGVMEPSFLEQNYEDDRVTPLPDVGGLAAEGVCRDAPDSDPYVDFRPAPTPRLYEPGGEG